MFCCMIVVACMLILRKETLVMVELLITRRASHCIKY